MKFVFKIKKQDYMKKKYINPTIEVMKIETTRMIAASTLGFGDPVDNANVAEGRELDLEDDDFDFDFSEEELGL